MNAFQLGTSMQYGSFVVIQICTYPANVSPSHLFINMKADPEPQVGIQ